MYKIGYILGDQFSQKESTAEDARIDNWLRMDISWQLRHPLVATMSADADKHYNCINHIIMSFLLLDDREHCCNAPSHPGNEICPADCMGGLHHFQRGAGARKSFAGYLPRKWGSPSMLANAELSPHALLYALELWVEIYLPY
jgi:hypothetical protein